VSRGGPVCPEAGLSIPRGAYFSEAFGALVPKSSQSSCSSRMKGSSSLILTVRRMNLSFRALGLGGRVFLCEIPLYHTPGNGGGAVWSFMACSPVVRFDHEMGVIQVMRYTRETVVKVTRYQERDCY